MKVTQELSYVVIPSTLMNQPGSSIYHVLQPAVLVDRYTDESGVAIAQSRQDQ